MTSDDLQSQRRFRNPDRAVGARAEEKAANKVEGRERHHGVGFDGMHREDEVVPTLVEDHAGLGADGELSGD